MGPTRKSKSVTRRYINEVSPPRDADISERRYSKKRRLAYMLGPRWTVEEVSRFYDAYRKYNLDWKKVAGAVRSRSPEMVEALFKMNRAYLSLPHGTASAAGLIAMVTDHYLNLVESDNDQESSDGARSSRQIQRHASGKFQPSTSKASADHCGSHSQTVSSNNGSLSLLKKKRSGVSRPRPVGKRTPRFPVLYDNSNAVKMTSPTRQGLKLNTNANANDDDDELFHEIAVSLTAVSQMKPTLVLTADMDGRVLEGSTGSDTCELSEFEQNSHLDDTKEGFSETGQNFGRTRGKLDVAVTNGKVSSFSMQRQREKSKKVIFKKDKDPAFTDLHILADLSLMMSATDEDDSKAQYQDGNDDHTNGLVSAEALRIKQHKGKDKFSGVRKKGYKPRPSSEEKIQNLQLSITETPRKNQTRQVPKIQKTAAGLNIRCSGSPRLEYVDPAKKLMNKRQKSLGSGSLNLLRNSKQSAEEILVVNQVLPTKVRSKRKIEPRKLQVQKDMNIPDKISNGRQDLSLALLHDRAFNLKEKLSICLSNPRLRKWCTYEWFYSAIDYPWFAKKEFVEYLHHVGLGNVPRLTRLEWGVIKSSLGKPRRFSEQFLKEEKEKLYQYRDFARKHYTEILSVGQRVVAIHPKTREIHDGRVLTVDRSRCRVQFDRHDLGVEYVMDIDCMRLNYSENMPALRVQDYMKLSSGDNANEVFAFSELSPSANPTSSLNLIKIQAKEADAEVLADLTRALEKKEALIEELRHLNDDANQMQGHSSLKDCEPFKKQYAAVLVQLNETNEHVASGLYRLRQRNTYLGNAALGLSSPGTDFVSQTWESRLHVNEIIESSRAEARAMVDAAVQEMSSLKRREDANEKSEEAVDYANEQLPSDDSSVPAASDFNATSASGMEAQIPTELISKCVSTMLMIQKCTVEHRPPSDVAQILDSAVKSLQPRSSKNLDIYAEIQQCLGVIRNQIISLVPASTPETLRQTG